MNLENISNGTCVLNPIKTLNLVTVARIPGNSCITDALPKIIRGTLWLALLFFKKKDLLFTVLEDQTQ